MATSTVADEPPMGPIDQTMVLSKFGFSTRPEIPKYLDKRRREELFCGGRKNRIGNRHCEVTMGAVSDAVRPRRAWILASADPNSSEARVQCSSAKRPGPRPAIQDVQIR